MTASFFTVLRGSTQNTYSEIGLQKLYRDSIVSQEDLGHFRVASFC